MNSYLIVFSNCGDVVSVIADAKDMRKAIKKISKDWCVDELLSATFLGEKHFAE